MSTRLAAAGLAHPRPDVQERVLDFLEGTVQEPAPRLAQAVGAQLSYVSPSQARRAEALAGRLAPASQNFADGGRVATAPIC